MWPGPKILKEVLNIVSLQAVASNVRGDPSDHSAQVIIRILAPYVENFNIEDAQNGVEKGASADDRHI